MAALTVGAAPAADTGLRDPVRPDRRAGPADRSPAPARDRAGPSGPGRCWSWPSGGGRGMVRVGGHAKMTGFGLAGQVFR